jgi:hypothetical protein
VRSEAGRLSRADLVHLCSQSTSRRGLRVAMGQKRTSGRWLDGMISACVTSGEYASFQSRRERTPRHGREETTP